MILLSVVFIYTIYTYAQDREEYCNDSICIECCYQFLLRRWHERADGQGQTPIDSAVRRRIFTHISAGYGETSPEKRKKIIDLGRYRGTGISIFDYGLRYECMSGKNYEIRFDGIAIKMVKEYYNINVDTKTICRGIWNHWIEDSGDSLVGVYGLPNDERIIFLISGITGEVLSTYKYKVKRMETE